MNSVNKFLDQKTFKLLENGIFCINKVKGITSAQSLEVIKDEIIKDVDSVASEQVCPLKVSHGGTLDQVASGVLVVGICEGCKLLSPMSQGKKTYLVQGKLGEATDTYSTTGNIIHQSSYSHVTTVQIRNTLARFRGKIMQTPPVYSKQGNRIADLVRPIQEVSVKPRQVECHEINLISYKPPLFTLNVTCGGGFYISSLINDLGQFLGTHAHIAELTRLRQGPFKLTDCVNFEEINLNNIIEAVNRINQKYSKIINKYLMSYENKQNNK